MRIYNHYQKTLKTNIEKQLVLKKQFETHKWYDENDMLFTIYCFKKYKRNGLYLYYDKKIKMNSMLTKVIKFLKRSFIKNFIKLNSILYLRKWLSLLR